MLNRLARASALATRIVPGTPRRGRRAPRGEDRVPRDAVRGRRRVGRRGGLERDDHAGLGLRRALDRRGIEVFAVRGASVDEFEADLARGSGEDFGPEIVVDDGAELTARIVRHRPDSCRGYAG